MTTATLHDTTLCSPQDFLLVSSYVRLEFLQNKKKTQMNSLFPECIFPIIAMYLKNPFEWYTKQSGNNMTFTNDNTTVISDPSNLNVLCISSNVVDRALHRMVEWEVTLDVLPSAHDTYRGGTGLVFGVGYIQYPSLLASTKDSDWNGSWIGEHESHEGCVYLDASNEYMELYCQRKGTPAIKSHRMDNVQCGDRLEIRFDFDHNRSLFYYNGEYVQVMYDDMTRDKYIPALCCAYDLTVTTTKWLLHYRENAHKT